MSLQKYGVELHLNTQVMASDLVECVYDQVVIATGVCPRVPDTGGIEHLMVMDYADAIEGRATIGKKVAIIGVGGIGFDLAELIAHEGFLEPSMLMYLRENGVLILKIIREEG